MLWLVLAAATAGNAAPLPAPSTPMETRKTRPAPGQPAAPAGVNPPRPAERTPARNGSATIASGDGKDSANTSSRSEAPDATNRENAQLVTLSPDGRTIMIRGMMRKGAAGQFEALLTQAATVERIDLESPGGLLFEAQQIAVLAGERKLDTRAVGECLSACTLVLVAGVHRTALPKAKIGFHRPYVSSERLAPIGEASEGPAIVIRYFYERAKLTPDFIDHVLATPSESMWYPSEADMVAANVLTVAGAVRQK